MESRHSDPRQLPQKLGCTRHLGQEHQGFASEIDGVLQANDDVGAVAASIQQHYGVRGASGRAVVSA